jgi:hypothetical protein
MDSRVCRHSGGAKRASCIPVSAVTWVAGGGSPCPRVEVGSAHQIQWPVLHQFVSRSAKAAPRCWRWRSMRRRTCSGVSWRCLCLRLTQCAAAAPLPPVAGSAASWCSLPREGSLGLEAARSSTSSRRAGAGLGPSCPPPWPRRTCAGLETPRSSSPSRRTGVGLETPRSSSPPRRTGPWPDPSCRSWPCSS